MYKHAFGKLKDFYKILRENFVWAIITFFDLVLAYFDIFHIGSLLQKIESENLKSLILSFSYIPIVLILGFVLVFVIDLIKTLIRGGWNDEIMICQVSGENPHVMTIQNKDQDWEHCRMRVDTLDGKPSEEYLHWMKGVITASSPVTEENCLAEGKISMDLIGISNQAGIKGLNMLHKSNKESLVGIHELKIKFMASRKNGELVARNISVKVEFYDRAIPGKEGKYYEGKILSVNS